MEGDTYYNPESSLSVRSDRLVINPIITDVGPIAPLLLTSRQAARMLAVSERTLWSLSADQKLPRVLIGRAIRYRLADLERFCEQMVECERRPSDFPHADATSEPA